jgi:transposase-like protein
MTSIIAVYRRWPTAEDCLTHLEQVRWGDSPECPYCRSGKVSKHVEKGQRSRWQCSLCKKSFSVTVGTLFHNSHIDLQRWFLLISLMFSAKKGLSAMQAARDLEMRRPTVWSMMHRIRAAMTDDGKLLSGLVEMDEAYIGGKPRKSNNKDDDPKGGDTSKRGRGTDKIPVVGAIERGGRVKARKVDKHEMTADDMERYVRAMIDTRSSVLTTDEYTGYNNLNNIVAHRRISHSAGYSRRDLFSGQFGMIHTNTIEGFWAIMKRAVYGQFHHVSKKYMHLYLNELTFRFNNRDKNGFEEMLCHAIKP